jgi:hypothetical protein
MKKLEQIISSSVNQYKANYFSVALTLNLEAIKRSKQIKCSNHIKSLAHSNTGFTYMALKEYKKAIQQFELANKYKQNDENSWSIFLCYANLLDWDNAKKYHHFRYGDTREAPTRVQFPKLPLPLAKNLNDLIGKKVLILNEQGLGDEILFGSSIEKICHLFDQSFLQLYPETKELFEQIIPSNVTIFTDRSFSIDFVNQFNVYTTLGDLFTFTSSKDCMGYTQKNPIPGEGIGFCWKANILSPIALKKNISPDQLEQFKGTKNISLQLKDNDDRPNWMEPMPEVNSLFDTAQIILGLDEVYTVDTSIAHLTGMLGKKGTVLINKHFDWRWKYVDKNGYSLFYPTLKILELI